MSWKRQKDVSKTSLQNVLKLFEDVLKISSRRLQNMFKTSWRCLEDVFKTFWKRLEDELKTYAQGKIYRLDQDIFTKSNVCWVRNL